jgi:hypothetical protein
MRRVFGLSLIVFAFLSLSPCAQAQSDESHAFLGYGYGGGFEQESQGGFGLEFGQELPAGSLFIDRYGILYQMPEFDRQRSTPAPHARPRQPRAGSLRVKGQARYQLPTGSLYWPDASRVLIYSPATRYRSYGAGYGIGPYGSVDHGMMYKGWPLQ